MIPDNRMEVVTEIDREATLKNLTMSLHLDPSCMVVMTRQVGRHSYIINGKWEKTEVFLCDDCHNAIQLGITMGVMNERT
jgi:hypothetical protein